MQVIPRIAHKPPTTIGLSGPCRLLPPQLKLPDIRLGILCSPVGFQRLVCHRGVRTEVFNEVVNDAISVLPVPSTLSCNGRLYESIPTHTPLDVRSRDWTQDEERKRVAQAWLRGDRVFLKPAP